MTVDGNNGLLLSAAGSHLEVRAFNASGPSVDEARIIDVAPARDPQEARALFTATAEVLAYALAAHSAERPRHIGIVMGRRLMRQPQSESQSD